MRAAPSSNAYTRNETIVVASSISAATGDPALDAALNALVLPTVKVTLETSTSGLIIDQGTAPPTIVAGQTTYSYNLSLNKQPAANETVTVALNVAVTDPSGNALSNDIVLQQNGVTVSSVTFNATNWNTPQTITVSSTRPALPAGRN